MCSALTGRCIHSEIFHKLNISWPHFEIIHCVGSCHFVKSVGWNILYVNHMLSFSALVVYCTKSRRAERYWQKTLLQMEEMESQIREEIRKGVFAQELTNVHTNTHSHCHIVQAALSGLFRTQMMFWVYWHEKRAMGRQKYWPHIFAWPPVCTCKMCVCLLVLSWQERSRRETQQLTDLCLVSATHKRQRLTNDQSHTRRT